MTERIGSGVCELIGVGNSTGRSGGSKWRSMLQNEAILYQIETVKSEIHL